MNNLIIYSIETAICLALFYTAYSLFLKNETFFKLNRLYLLCSVAISFLVPLLNITLAGKEDSFITKYLVSPVEQYEHSITGEISDGNINSPNRLRHFGENINGEKGGKPVNSAAAQTSAKTFSSSLPADGDPVAKNNWPNIVLTIYIIGASLLLFRFLASITWIAWHAVNHKPQQVSGMKIIWFKKNVSPFSFLNFVFISQKEYPENELAKIIAHEKVHANQKHSLDLILFELLLILQWFNPSAWMYKRAIRINHEYLADQGTLSSGVDPEEYQHSLLNQVLSENNIALASNYNLSIKKRIAMMLKKRSPKRSALKISIALPIILLLFAAFAFTTGSREVVNNSLNKSLASKDSGIKKIEVPVTYLKLLEGEYISTNEKGKRTIVFTELLGTLFGWDNGYTYKIIPIGGEKFINPDDKASLEFNSKNKDAISLLLFGKVNLNKAKVAKAEQRHRSMALTLANLMLKNGIESGLSFYRSAKDSNNYFLTEIDMSYAGFELMQAGKTKEAVALLKLDTEIFNSSFNSFDSYAEALLANGDKAEAIEAFKESLKLNPGSRNAIKRLKELGLNPDEVVKPVKIPMEELKALEGIYFSVDQPTWMRKITLKIVKGELMGEDNGYNYKLIAMGNGKFVNPDDGVYLVFDTRDKDNITFLIFGKTTMRKVRVLKPEVSLKEYAGVYFPSAQDTILKPMEIVASDNKLFRYIAAEPEVGNRTIDLEFVTGNIFYYTDKSGRSIEFTVNDKKQVTGCLLKRWDGVFVLTKKK
jgi:hypothetical protein